MKFELVLTPCGGKECEYPKLTVVNTETGVPILSSCLSVLSIGEARVHCMTDREVQNSIQKYPPAILVDMAVRMSPNRAQAA